MLYTWKQCQIILEVNCNLRIKNLPHLSTHLYFILIKFIDNETHRVRGMGDTRVWDWLSFVLGPAAFPPLNKPL